MGGLVSMVTGKGNKAAERAAAEARRKQEESLKKQEAVQARQRQDADKREEELSAQEAAQRRAIRARRSGAAGLQYGGPITSSTLKDKLGG